MKSINQIHKELPYRKTNDQPISTLLKQLMNQYGYQDKLDELKIRSIWQMMMGESIFSYTGSIKLRKGILWIEISSSSLKKDLSLGKDKLKSRINLALSNDIISDIKFV